VAEESTEKLIEKVQDYVFLYDTGHPEYKNIVKKKVKHGEGSFFSSISCIHHRLLSFLQLSANRRRSSSSSELDKINPLNSELNPICYLLALLAHRFLHVSRIRVKSLTLRLLMSYIYIWSVYS